MGYVGDQKRAYQAAWLRARRDAWLLENGPCVKCGSDEDLQVDHIVEGTRDPKLKSSMGTAIWSWSAERRVVELEKCQVLCLDCHREKTSAWYEAKRKHGRTMYERYNCRCETCFAAKQRNNARRYARKV